MNRRTRFGREGEDAAVRLLEDSGYAVIARNVRLPGGEIDVIARDHDTYRLHRGQGTRFAAVRTRRCRPSTRASGGRCGRWPPIGCRSPRPGRTRVSISLRSKPAERACTAGLLRERDGEKAARRALPDRRADRTRRHVRRLSRPGRRAAAAGRDQDPDRPQRRSAQAFPARSAVDGAAQPSQHRRRLRRRAKRRRLVHRDGTRAGPHAGHDLAERVDRPHRAALHARAARSAGVRAREQRRPPRRQTGQHHGARERRDQGDGLRPFAPHERDVERHERGRNRRHDRLPLAGALPGQDRRRAQRSLQRRRRDVRSIHRHRAVQERIRRSRRGDLRARQRAAGRAAHDQSGGAGADRAHRAAPARKGSGSPLCFGARSDRRYPHAARPQRTGRSSRPRARSEPWPQFQASAPGRRPTAAPQRRSEAEARSILERTFGNTQTLNEGYANTLAGMLAARKRDWSEATRAYVPR